MNNSFQIICARLPDHQGVPNATLVNEHSPLAAKYDNKSVAEQNSVDLAWDIFMSEKFQNLRSCICCDEEEFKRFRQLGMLDFASIVFVWRTNCLFDSGHAHNIFSSLILTRDISCQCRHGNRYYG